jgi:hypothetical protein
MKKILITESQLKRLTKNLVTENIVYNGNKISYNSDGTINVNNIKIRLIHTNKPLIGKGEYEINIVELKLEKDGLHFTTKMGISKVIPLNVLIVLTNYAKSKDTNDKYLMDGKSAGDVYARKV